MSNHLEIKHKLIQVNRRSTFNEMLEDSMLNEKEKQMLRMHYIENKSLDYIADELGYSKAGIIKMHKRSLQKLGSLL